MKKKIIMFSALLMLMTGCREHEFCDYKAVRFDVFNGDLSILVDSTPDFYKEKGKRHASHGLPYELSIIYMGAPDTSEVALHLESLTVSAVGSKSILQLDKYVQRGRRRELDVSRATNTKNAGFVCEISKDMGLKYEDYIIEFDLTVIHADGSEITEQINVRLERDYSKKKLSDIWENFKVL